MDFFGTLQIALYIIAALLHAVGLGLLSSVKHSPTFSSVQRLFFFNISTCDILGCVLSISAKIVGLAAPEWWSANKNVMHRIGISGMYIWYIGLMTLLTMDRFLTVYLNLRYRMVCTFHRARMTLLSLFVFSLACTLVCVNVGTTEDIEYVMLYAWLVLDGVFLCVALVTYIYFFRKIKRNRRYESVSLPSTFHESLNHKSSTTESKCRSRKFSFKKGGTSSLKRAFFTPSLLVGNFIVFWLLPDQIFFCLNIMRKRFVSPVLIGLLLNFYPFGILLDAVIYIFFQREIISLLKKKIQNLRRSML